MCRVSFTGLQTESDEKSAIADSQNRVPKTGDESTIYLWGILLLVSAAGLAAMPCRAARRKKIEKEMEIEIKKHGSPVNGFYIDRTAVFFCGQRGKPLCLSKCFIVVDYIDKYVIYDIIVIRGIASRIL